MAISRRTNTAGRVIGWQVRLDRRDEHGRRVRLTIGTYRTKKEAEREERRALEAQERGTFVDPSVVTVGEWLAVWADTKQHAVSANTMSDYRAAIRLHLLPAFGSMLLQKLTPTHVQRQYDAWIAGGMSPRMVHRCHLVLSQALAQAVRLGVASRNVAADAELPRQERTAIAVWTPEETAAFLRAAAQDPWAPLWCLLALEGLRRGEALGLRWEDLNWERGTAHLVQTIVVDKSNKGAALIQPRTKTASGARTVRLTRQTLASLRAHRDRQRLARVESELVLCTGVGTPIHPVNVARAFRGLVLLAGVPRIRVHDLRHTVATNLLRSGVPLSVVSERLGHAGIQITKDIYGHLGEHAQETAADVMSDLMDRLAGS